MSNRTYVAEALATAIPGLSVSYMVTCVLSDVI